MIWSAHPLRPAPVCSRKRVGPAAGHRKIDRFASALHVTTSAVHQHSAVYLRHPTISGCDLRENLSPSFCTGLGLHWRRSADAIPPHLLNLRSLVASKKFFSFFPAPFIWTNPPANDAWIDRHKGALDFASPHQRRPMPPLLSKSRFPKQSDSTIIAGTN